MILPYFNYINKKNIYCAQNNMRMPLNIEGKWNSNFGEMILIQKNNQVTGYYYYNDGMITGTMYKNTLTADWVEYNVPPKDYGKTILNFSQIVFNGKYSYREGALYYAWYGNKISTIFKNNCYRYHVINKVDRYSNIKINNKIKLDYEQVSKYIYPKKCVKYVDLEITINKQTTGWRMEVQPGFSYLFSIEGIKDNIIINSIIENPFYK